MDGTSSFLAQRGRAKWDQPTPKSWASSGAPCSIFNGDQVWLEELIGPSSYLSSSPSDPNNSSPPGGSRNSSEGSGSLHSWSSGAPCSLRGCVKKQNHDVFQTGPREERRRPRAHPQVEQGEGNIYSTIDAWPERAGLDQGRSSTQIQTSARSVKQQSLLEETVKAKRKFSRFLDEVASNVLDPKSLQAFGKPVSPSSFNTTTQTQSEDKIQEATHWSPRLPCSMAQQQGSVHKQNTTRDDLDPAQKTYQETNIDAARRDEEAQIKVETAPQLETDEENVIPPPPQFCQGFEMKSPFPEFQRDFPRYPHKSASLPRGMNMVPDEEMNGIDTISCCCCCCCWSGVVVEVAAVVVVVVGGDCGGSSGLHVEGVSLSFKGEPIYKEEEKEDLRKRLSYTTHKLELLQSEFDSTRQYLETELRRAQEELDKFTDKLRSPSSLCRQSQHHDDEKRALSREIIVLNNHLMEAKLTIEKLQEDNDLYRKDCNLAAQLLQCNKSLYRAQLSELPADFQERLTMHMEESPLCHTYPDTVPASLIAKVLEKPDEACSSSQASRSPSPQTQDHAFILERLGPGERLRLRAAYKSDLYSSDTALYCPDDRHRERRPSMDLHGQRKLLYGPQNSTDSNPEEGSVGLRAGFSQEHFAKFPATLGAGSSSYSSFSGGGSEDKGNGPPSSAASSPRHHSLYMDWRDAGDYERKSDSSWERDSPRGFANAHPFQQTEMSHHQNGSSPVYSRTMSSCFSEPYEPLPPSSSPSVAYGDSRRGSTLAPEEEELIGRWRQLSVEDLSAHTYRSPGRASPYSFSEQHFSVRPAKIRLGPLYSSFQEGADYYHHGVGAMDPVWVAASPSPECSPGLRQAHSQAHLYRAEDSQGSEHSLYHSGSSKDREGNVAAGGQSTDYVDPSPNSSTESLNQRTLEMAAEMQHYQAEMHSMPAQVSQSPPPAPPPPPPYNQKFGSLGLSRKDSLTKAQLYGTLLN
ncbi:Brain-enriched guanylate kinase-associated protein [Nibea albiflora]|uniref:Brain-enriched guanylate kinase-associated protein n=1 Tax=Nibea albiflora TaxID=240163 RepID=A0ACB7FB71_NIBAL|nr:Brain-enriched guanylate kinase-associated protein [Nibea albiflora]